MVREDILNLIQSSKVFHLSLLSMMLAAGFFFFNSLVLKRASQVVLVAKNPPAIAEMEEM